MNKKKKGYESLNRIKLLMKYDSKQTLSENLSRIKEQSVVGAANYGGVIDQKYTEEKEDKNKYPNYCSSKDRAISLTGFKNEAGLEGSEALPKEFCIYKQPYPNCKLPGIEVTQLQGTKGFKVATKEKPKPKAAYLLLHKDAKIKFFDQTNIQENFRIFLENFSTQEIQKMNLEYTFNQFVRILPLGSVCQWSFGGSNYLPYMCYTPMEPNGTFEFMGFKGYINQNNEVYVNPIKPDEREPWERVIDDYGTMLQWVAVIATAISGLFCDGCTWPLFAEIALELGIGIPVGIREWEKGYEVTSVGSFMTAVLPVLKNFKQFRGIPQKHWDELTDAFANSNLTTSSTQAQWKAFYETLSDDAQLALNQIVRTDEISKARFLGKSTTELGNDIKSIYVNEIRNLLKTDPTLIRKVPLAKRLWFRELGSNLVVGVSAFMVSLLYGDKLNTVQNEKLTQEYIDKLDGVYEVIPEKLKEEMMLNMTSNPLHWEAILNDPNFQKISDNVTSEQSESLGSTLGEAFAKSLLKDTIVSNGGIYEDITPDVPSFEVIKADEKTLDSLKQNGWRMINPLTDLNTDYEGMKVINDSLYIKPLKKN